MENSLFSTLILGLLIHMPMMLQDIPNHDGLDSMHFDQNMITSGRWFLTIACGISSYFTLPWLIGLLALVYLAFTSAALVEFLEIRKTASVVLVAGLLVGFPAVASTFAYVFTMDGYMMALFLAVLSVVLTKKYKFGFIPGAVCLACSMGTYQAYLPFAVLLCIYGIIMIAMSEGKLWEKVRSSLRYLYMGMAGVAGYYIVLQVLLKLQGKELASYQGIENMGTVEGAGILGIIVKMYRDFAAFTLKGNVLINNVYSLIAACGLVLILAATLVQLACNRRWWKNIWLYGLLGLLAVGLPIATNIILVVSPDVTYHMLMRYQWILYPVFFIAFVERYGWESEKDNWKI